MERPGAAQQKPQSKTPESCLKDSVRSNELFGLCSNQRKQSRLTNSPTVKHGSDRILQLGCFSAPETRRLVGFVEQLIGT